MCNKLLLPTATIFVFVGHINSFPKNVSALFNVLQRALQGVAACLNTFKRNAQP